VGVRFRKLFSGFVPPPIKRFLRELRWARAVSSSMQELLALEPGVVPPAAVLRRLRAAWGNEGFTAHAEYVDEVARQAAISQGPILECGTGLTTLVLASVAGRRGIDVYSLEQDPAWAARVGRALAAAGLQRGTVRLAPLAEYDGYSWYDCADVFAQLRFRLVVCDGPRGDTPGGRYGLLPRMKSHLASGALILLDDASREGEQEVLRRWLAEGCTAVQHPAPRMFAAVTHL
jgi:predicted O-methyltransferase YrrM